jgi:hypothetical protein
MIAFQEFLAVSILPMSADEEPDFCHNKSGEGENILTINNNVSFKFS